MKKYLPGILAITAALSFTSFRGSTTYLMVEVTLLTTANVGSPNSYADDHIHECPGFNANPCVLDLTLIPASFAVTDRATFITYLQSRFPSQPALQVQEVNRIAVEWYD
jgi:hypothetical protein